MDVPLSLAVAPSKSGTRVQLMGASALEWGRGILSHSPMGYSCLAPPPALWHSDNMKFSGILLLGTK